MLPLSCAYVWKSFMKSVEYPFFLDLSYIQVPGNRLVSEQRNEQATQENGKFSEEN